MTTTPRPGDPPPDGAGRPGKPAPAGQLGPADHQAAPRVAAPAGPVTKLWQALTGRRAVPPGQQRPPRWGIRMLGFLALAIVALLTASELGRWTPGTSGCTVLGLGGALFCTVKGLRNVDLSPRREPPPEHLDPDADRWNTGAGRPAGRRPSASPSAPSASPSAPSAPASPSAPSTDDPTTETDR